MANSAKDAAATAETRDQLLHDLFLALKTQDHDAVSNTAYSLIYEHQKDTMIRTPITQAVDIVASNDKPYALKLIKTLLSSDLEYGDFRHSLLDKWSAIADELLGNLHTVVNAVGIVGETSWKTGAIGESTDLVRLAQDKLATVDLKLFKQGSPLWPETYADPAFYAYVNGRHEFKTNCEIIVGPNFAPPKKALDILNKAAGYAKDADNSHAHRHIFSLMEPVVETLAVSNPVAALKQYERMYDFGHFSASSDAPAERYLESAMALLERAREADIKETHSITERIASSLKSRTRGEAGQNAHRLAFALKGTFESAVTDTAQTIATRPGMTPVQFAKAMESLNLAGGQS